MVLQSTESYNAKNKILAGVCGLRSPVSRTLDASLVTADANGKKHFLPGQFYGEAGTKCRPLPRTKTAEIATAASTTVLTVDNASLFVATDVLYCLAPMAQIDLALVWASGDTLAVVVGGQSYTYTSDTATLADIATAAAAGINASPALSQMVTAVASGAAIWVYAKDFLTPYTIGVTATTAGSGTAVISGSFTTLQAYQSIGTVATAGVNTTNNQLTLTAAASIDLPIDLPIGAISTPLGMSVSEIDLTSDSTLQDEIIGLYTAASIQSEVVLPYWDGELSRLFDIDFAN